MGVQVPPSTPSGPGKKEIRPVRIGETPSSTLGVQTSECGEEGNPPVLETGETRIVTGALDQGHRVRSEMKQPTPHRV